MIELKFETNVLQMDGGRNQHERPAIPSDRCHTSSGKTNPRFRNMRRHFTRTAAFAVGAVLMCQLAFASAPAEETQAPNRDVQKETPVKKSRPLYLSLPASVIHAFRHPVQKIRSWFSHDHARHAADAGNNPDARTDSSVSAAALLPERQTHRRTSMYIGMAPPPVPSDEPGPYRHDAAADARSCGNADNTRGGSAGAPDTDIKGPLLNNLSVGLCMKF